jgi:hypothetical protein
MSSKPKNVEQQQNGSLLTLSIILSVVVASAAEAEIDTFFKMRRKESIFGTSFVKSGIRSQLHPCIQIIRLHTVSYMEPVSNSLANQYI